MLDELRRRFESEVDRLGVTRIANGLGVSRGTVYNWVASGNAPLDKLIALQAAGMDLLYVITGDRSAQAMSPEETLLLDRYRASPRELRDAALRVLLGGGDPPSPKNKKVKQTVSGTANQVVGINQGGVSHGETRGRPGSKRKG